MFNIPLKVYREGRRMSSIPVNKLQNDSWRRSQSKYSWRPELGLEFHAVLPRKFWVSM